MINSKTLINSFKNQNILVVGDIFLDSYIKGSINRLSPEYPVPVIDYNDVEYSLGGTGNLCANIGNLGANIFLLSQISNDNSSKILKNLINKVKIDKSLIFKNKNIKTITKTRVTVQGHHFLRLDRENTSDIENNKINDLINWKRVSNIIKKIDKVVISDYGKGFCNEINLKKLISLSKKNKIPILIDPRKKNKNYKIYSGCDLITPNLNELRLIKPDMKNLDTDIVKTCKILIKKFGIEKVLATRSEEGVTLVTNNKIIHDKVIKSNVFDVSGAGDTILSIISLLYNSEIDEKIMLKIANLCAKYVISFHGTKPIDKNSFIKIVDNV